MRFSYEQDMKSKQYEKALEKIFRAIDMEPQVTAHLINGAQVLALVGKLEEAERFLMKAIADEPDNFSAYYTLGNLYYNASRYEEAIRVYLLGYVYNPEDADINYMIAMSYVNTEDRVRAIPFFEAARNNNADYDCVFQYGLLCCDLERYKEGEILLEEALTLKETPDVLYNLGLAKYMLNEDKEVSINLFKRAIELDPSHHLAQHALKNFKEME